MRGYLKRLTAGFTLIELLIVVAIIAILAAIAVPNFLEAQMRAKVARVKSDMRTISIALEAYVIDHNKPPHSKGAADRNPTGQWNRNGLAMITNLSTPISYLSNVSQFLDPFCPAKYYDPEVGGIPDDLSQAGDSGKDRTVHLTYVNIYGWGEGWASETGQQATRRPEVANHWAKWVLISLGPDYLKGPDARTGKQWYVGDYGRSSVGRQYNKFAAWDYDPTNGSTSRGDILRWSH